MNRNDLIRRLASKLEITLPVADEIYKALKAINLEAVHNKDNIKIPGIGNILIVPYDMEQLVYSPVHKQKVPRQKTHYFKLDPLDSALNIFHKGKQLNGKTD